MASIFISYRHLDSIDITGRLWDHLKGRFGERRIFLDYKRMTGGDDFLEVIDREIASADVLVSVIGPHWKGETSNQYRNIHNPTDVVRREIERALQRGIPVLPVMVGGASFLTESDVPESLKPLSKTHALSLRSDLDFDDDLRRIVECLDGLINRGHTYLDHYIEATDFMFSAPLTSKTSSARTLMLIGLRSMAILGTLMFAVDSIKRLVKVKELTLLHSLTSFGALTLTIALIGLILLLYSLFRTRVLTYVGRRRQEYALKELAGLIFSRLSSPQLLTATSVHSLAMGLELKHHCTIITDKLISEAIRAAAIKVEYVYPSKEKMNNLRLLNALLLSIDKNASPLCSIAVVDRLSAYIQSQPILLGGLIALTFFLIAQPLVFGSTWSCGIFSAIAGITMASLFLAIWTERAIRYWRPAANTNLSETIESNSSFRIVSDFFLTASCARSSWTHLLWDLIWGPVWENIMFLWRSERQIAVMHEFRFDVAQDLWNKLKMLDISLNDSLSKGPVARVIDVQNFRETARRLWIVTGDPQFRVIEKRGIIERRDRESGIVGLL